MSTQRQHHLTAEQYLAIERQAEFKSEFINGEMYAMAGASFPRTVITANVARALGNRLEGRPCSVVSSDLHVQISETGAYTYPGVVVVCDKPILADKAAKELDTLLNPTLIVEVLSPTTALYDRSEKFAHYRRRESLTDYLLVAQDRALVEHYARQGKQWVLSDANTLDASLTIASLSVMLPLAEAYARVEFPEAAEGDAARAPR